MNIRLHRLRRDRRMDTDFLQKATKGTKKWDGWDAGG